MNWYIKQIFAQSEGLQKYLENLGVSSNIIQYINSLDKKKGQILVNEVRKNPSLTLEQLQSFQTPQQINPYSNYEINTAKNYPEPMKTWILVNLRKLRVQKELSTENKRAEIHNTYMYLIDNLPQILDWVQLSQPPIDISSYTPERAINASDEWHRTMSAQGEGEVYEKTNPELIVYGPDWKNPQWKSWTIQKVIRNNDLIVEGNKMDHCVGSYCKNVENKYSDIYSLRDSYNEPHVTIETNGENNYNTGTIKQIQGKSNSEPKDEYKAMIKEWISNSGEESKIIKEINTFEELENENYYQNDGVEQLTDAIEKILQGESNEYGLKYVFDSDIESIIIKLVEAGEAENNNRDSNYYGNITNSPPYITNLALMQDLKLSHWPRHAGEWEELQKMPKQSEWENIQEIEKWAFKTIDEIQEDFIRYETGLEYPQEEEEYEDLTEYEEAMEQFSEAKSEVFNEWTKQSVKGGFALDLLNELKSFRESELIPNPTELYEMQKKKEEEKIKNSPVYQEAYSKGQQMRKRSLANGKNWYKKAQQLNINPYLSKEEKRNIRELNNLIKQKQQTIEMYQNGILEKQNKAIQENRPINEEEQNYINQVNSYVIPDINISIQRLQENIEEIKNKIQQELSGQISKERKTTNLINEAVKEFKTTNDINEAGYIMPNGRMLDFSAKREGALGGDRPIDHREIIRLKGIKGNGTDGMIEFMNNTGAIRVNSHEGLSIDISKPITPQQITTILKNLRGKEYFGIETNDINGNTTWHKEIEFPRILDVKKLIDEANAQF